MVVVGLAAAVAQLRQLDVQLLVYFFAVLYLPLFGCAPLAMRLLLVSQHCHYRDHHTLMHCAEAFTCQVLMPCMHAPGAALTSMHQHTCCAVLSALLS